MDQNTDDTNQDTNKRSTGGVLTLFCESAIAAESRLLLRSVAVVAAAEARLSAAAEDLKHCAPVARSQGALTASHVISQAPRS